MTERERLIATASVLYARDGLIDTSLYSRLLEEGVDVAALFNTISEED